MTRAALPRTDAVATAERAFAFAYPLVLMEYTRAWSTAVASPSPESLRAPMNRLSHARTPRPPEAGAEPPNPDVLRSAAWLDLRAGPIGLSVPDAAGRYYTLTLIDMWTEAFAAVGARTTGTNAGAYAIAGPRWNGGALPVGFKPITAPTCFVHIAGQTQTDEDGDDAAAHRLQEGCRLRPLPYPWRTSMPPPEAPPASAGATPVEQVDALDPRTFFAEVARLMRINPPHAADRPVVEQMRAGGLLSDWDALEPATRDALEDGARQGMAAVRAQAGSSPGSVVVGHWRVYYGRGRFHTDYLARAATARAGLAADAASDAIPAVISADAEGRPLSGRHRYVLSFPLDAPPPVDGFWSLTAYDRRERAAGDWRSIGDRNGLTVDRDGSLRIHIQREPPAGELDANWLQAPPEDFDVVLRLYWPRGEALVREWVPPELTRLDG